MGFNFYLYFFPQTSPIYAERIQNLRVSVKPAGYHFAGYRHPKLK